MYTINNIEEFTLAGVNFCTRHGFTPTMDKGATYFSLHDAFHERIAAPPTKEGELQVHHYQDGVVGKPFTPNPDGELYAGHTLSIDEQYQAWFTGIADAEFYFSASLLAHIRALVK